MKKREYGHGHDLEITARFCVETTFIKRNYKNYKDLLPKSFFPFSGRGSPISIYRPMDPDIPWAPGISHA